MNIENFRNQKPRPRKEEFNTTFFYSGGKVLGKGRTLNEVRDLRLKYKNAVEETLCDNEAFQAAMKEYNELKTALEAAFKRGLFEENDINADEFGEAMYKMAFDRGHEYGYHRIQEEFEDLVVLERIARKVFK